MNAPIPNLGSWLFLGNIGLVHLLIIWCALTIDVVEPAESTKTEAVQTAESETAPADDSIGSAQAAWLDGGGLPEKLDLDRLYVEDGRLNAELHGGWTAELTTVPALQDKATRILDRAKVPFGAVVVLDLKNSDVLVMADRYDEKHAAAPALPTDAPRHLALAGVAPAASIFKIVTAAGLHEAGLGMNTSLPFKPAKRKIDAQHLAKATPGEPTSTLADALMASNNGFFARQANRLFTRTDLVELSRRFGFNRIIPFPLETDASRVLVKGDRLSRARMAAGFWNSYLTPLHASLIAAAVATDGQLPSPRIVRSLKSPDGRNIQAIERTPFSKAMNPSTADKLRKSMAKTISHGTGRRAFAKWPKKLRHIKVGGKTGSLSQRDPFTAFTWFVGYAPVDNPEIAIAVVVGNGELWWQKAADVARDVMASYFDQNPIRRTGRSASKKTVHIDQSAKLRAPGGTVSALAKH